MLPSLLAVCVASVLVCAWLTRWVRNLALARAWLDHPDTGRHLHSNPVPRLGGVPIFLTVFFVVGAALLLQRWCGAFRVFSIGSVPALLLPAALIFVAGLYDDIRSLGPYAKFGVQALAACVLYLDGFGIRRFDLLFSGSRVQVFVGLPLTILWVLLITNAFNLIDGMDGLAAGSALFSTLVLLVASVVGGNHLVTFLAAILAGAIAGFLRFNFNPATIFLGDSGSLFIGFTLGAMALAGSQKAPAMVAIAMPVVCFGLPLLDVAMALLRRFLSGRPLFQGDAEHIHHRLLNRGLSQRGAVLILYGVSAAFGLLSLALLHGGGTMALVLVALGAGACAGIPQLHYRELSEMRRVLARTASQKRIIANDLRIRRAVESLGTCRDAAELSRILAAALEPIGFDGFGLRLSGAAWLPQSLPSSLRRGPHGELRCVWSLPAALEAGWELRLDLASGGDKIGIFSVYRRSAEKPLLLDINLLGEGFQVALASAVRRTFRDAFAEAEDYAPAASAGARRLASIPSLD